jgi:hypothetical protein
MKVSATVRLTRREVVKGDLGYQVMERRPHTDMWLSASKVYRHSTSAYAALGRLTQKESKAK